jgi:hypothetical protein
MDEKHSILLGGVHNSWMGCRREILPTSCYICAKIQILKRKIFTTILLNFLGVSNTRKKLSSGAKSI